ncbi:hypothetical protein IEO21_09410 [Rhodonia placenta]|uniref:Uncharacterized protein n=1 Tax=Rhodonia placenta TaxID=104341 RepID=A0A8H7NUD2_9APHY|nr:hypothetical protein IEO21_09410 [Postia placenta]
MDDTNSITTGIVPTAMLRPLPVEIWLMIIDELGAEREYDALEACTEADEGLLKERAERYVPNGMTFRTQEDVASINVRQRWEGPENVCIEGGSCSGERLPIPHLAAFTSRLARKWIVHKLTIERAEWRVQDLDMTSLSLDLAFFDSLTHVRLQDVTFPSVLTFWRLLGTLRFTQLDVRDVTFLKTAIDARTFSALRLSPATMQRTMSLLRPQNRGRQRLATLPSLQVAPCLLFPQASPSPWSNITHLALMDVTLPTAANFGRLLCAFPALKSLSIEGLLMFSEHGFNPSDVPMLLKLTDVELDNNFSLWSDAQTAYRYLKKHPHMQLRAQLSYSVKVTHEDSSWIAPLLELLY